MKPKILIVLILQVLAALNASAIPLNIVSNGDFETALNLFSPWQFTQGFTAFINDPTFAASGNNCIFVGGGPSGGDMWQDLTTVVGETYQFSFYERGDDPAQTERLSLLNVWWGGQEVGSYINDNKVPGWNYIVFDVLATSTTTRVDFQQASASVGSPYSRPGVDGVSAVAVPDTLSTICFLGLGVTMCACFRRGLDLGRR